MKLPFPRSYWVVPGRLLAGFYPGDRDALIAEQKLHGLLDAGVSRTFNLMEADEVNYDGTAFVPYEPVLQRLAGEQTHPMECSRYPIVDRTAPTRAWMRTILDDLDAALTAGQVVYVHCWGGKGRTATVVGCHLTRALGITGAAAVERLGQLTAHHPSFRPAPQMECQREFILQWSEDATLPPDSSATR